jgi:hypothetical protein
VYDEAVIAHLVKLQFLLSVSVLATAYHRSYQVAHDCSATPILHIGKQDANERGIFAFDHLRINLSHRQSPHKGTFYLLGVFLLELLYALQLDV